MLPRLEASQMRDDAVGVGADPHEGKGATAEQLVDAVAPPTAPPPRLDEQAMSALIHELGAPITVIEGFIELLDGPLRDLDDETFHRAVDAIRRNAAQLRGVLTAFADARRIDVDALDLRRASTDVSLLLAEVCESLRTIVGKHEITLDAEPGLRADIDAVRVQQIVINLVQNAAKFSDPGAPIEVEAASAGGTLRIAVTDHGGGVPAQERGRIFGKFTRLNRDKPGTGLGLYICRGIARAHGGDLVLEEAGAGGCRFALTLPIGSQA